MSLNYLYHAPDLYEADICSLENHDDDYWLNFAPFDRLLEIGCGTGRLTVLWAKFGKFVTALDESLPMITWCQKRYAQHNRIEWVHHSFLNYQSSQIFDAIAIPLNTFNHFLSRHEQRQALQACHQLLKPGGWLGLDVFNPQVWVPWKDYHLSRQFYFQGDLWQRFEKHVTHDQPQFILDILYKCPEKNLEKRLGALLRRVCYEELSWLLNQTGFDVRHSYGDYDKKPFAGWEPHILMTAQRRNL